MEMRIATWKEVQEDRRPSLFGYGFGGTKKRTQVTPEYKKNRGYEYRTYKTVDNGYIKILIESGLVGLLIFLLIFVFAFKTMFTLYNHKKISERDKSLIYAIFCIMVGFTFRNLTGDLFEAFPFNFYTWTFLGIIYNINYRLTNSIVDAKF
jgi:O-antigen ligase